ncbi:loganic acid O-methyltransferase-like [Henckelia pumila]|uniref:loganic acid O-methyltransferase-like n=1 Tax=Henckelia pumila TaxID=405737 RepID=UPI003C6E467D
MAAAPMNGGSGIYSYANNSHVQRDGFNSTKNIIRDVIIENLDFKTLVSSASNTITIADLGCSIGPNTFLAMEKIINAIEQEYHNREGHINPTNLEFQVFFNDQVSNDFNTLFASVPIGRNYYAAGVAGSFYGRLFPTSSISIAYSSFSINWLSKIPKELVDKKSPAWNKGKIHYAGAKNEVVGAYTTQFDEDMDMFLNARGKEIVNGGMIVIILFGVPDGAVTNDVVMAFSFLESIITDMVKEGLINQDEMDSFNIPCVYPSVKQMSRIVEKNGCFSIARMELNAPMINPITDHEAGIMHLRAAVEGTFANHFGSKLVDEIFRRAVQQKSKLDHIVESAGTEITSAKLLLVLKRK